ncbi:MAG: low-specificity L-threonine aldolase [Anaerolineae bacterium]|nr:low-specificity L-threonine aldolase [Anaerolineae bacterium]
MEYIDLRSDTVTWPTPKMREAMANAAVGDDVWGDDPTVIELQHEAAAILGKEAGLFVASGSMGNLIAALTHCQRGSEMIVGKQSHMFVHEAGSASALGGIHPNTIEVNRDGTMDLDAIRAAVRDPHDEHYPLTRLVCLENTHGGRRGVPVSADYTAQVGEIARAYDLRLHIDGARIFNAAAALNIPVHELVAPADSVSFCLSKGLCAPVGSVLVGSQAFIAQARRMRKLLGGGMRQVGVLAAAGLIALREMTPRLKEDHVNACSLAEGLAQLPHIRIDPATVYTNMIYFDILPTAPRMPADIMNRLKDEYKILMAIGSDGQDIRLVTHYWITPDSVQQILKALRELLA